MDRSTLPSQHDLRTFFQNVGDPLYGPALTAEPADRRDTRIEVELVETARQVKVTAAPLDVTAFIDGIQNSLIITHREHRPVYLSFQAAGAVGAGASLLGLKQRIAIVCSAADRDWVDSVNTMPAPLAVHELVAVTPPDVERAAYTELGQGRDDLERDLVNELIDAGRGPLVVDGSLLKRPYTMGVHGVVKNVIATRYLPDEAVLYGLPAGWRSPIFRIPALTDGCPYDRYSTYLRLHDARDRSWSHGLIRLETFDPDRLDALAARALVERQHPGSGDARWDRHLKSVALTEEALRAMRPEVFGFRTGR